MPGFIFNGEVPGCEVNHIKPLIPSIRISGAVLPFFPYAFMEWTGTTLLVYFYLNNKPMTNPRSYKYNIVKYSTLCVISVNSGNKETYVAIRQLWWICRSE
jgi:hypothetical protein